MFISLIAAFVVFVASYTIFIALAIYIFAVDDDPLMSVLQILLLLILSLLYLVHTGARFLGEIGFLFLAVASNY